MNARLTLAATAVALALARSAAADPAAWHEQGLTEYERGHYASAAAAFHRAADEGDARSAEMLALMYRYGSRLYGDAFAGDAAEARRWAAVAAERRQTRLVAKAAGRD